MKAMEKIIKSSNYFGKYFLHLLMMKEVNLFVLYGEDLVYHLLLVGQSKNHLKSNAGTLV